MAANRCATCRGKAAAAEHLLRRCWACPPRIRLVGGSKLPADSKGNRPVEPSFSRRISSSG